MTKVRLHEIEGLLELVSTDPWIFKPSELYEISGELREELKRYKIYLIGRRNRITLDCSSLKIGDGGESVSGLLQVNRGGIISKIPFKFSNPINLPIIALGRMDYPYTHLEFIVEGVRPIKMRLHDVIRFSSTSLGSLFDLKIEYIGQSFGDEGSSDALQRLIGNSGKQGHGSFQKVLADLLDRFPDNESYILFYSYEQYKNYAFMGGITSAIYDAEHDEDRFERLMSISYSRENRIDLIEAGLIRYFQPKYNEIYKKTFPQKSHDMLQSLFQADVTGLAVSLSTMEHKLNIFSDHVSPSSIHCAQYSIVLDSERLSFLDLTTF